MKKISEFENTSIKTSQTEKQRGVTEKGGEKYQALWEIYESVNKERKKQKKYLN